MTEETAMRDRAESLLAEFMNLVRVQIDDIEQPPGSARSESMKLWYETYGRIAVEGKSHEDVLAQVGMLVHDKLFVAATVAMVLAAELAEAQGGKMADVLDRVELKLSKMFGTGQLP